MKDMETFTFIFNDKSGNLCKYLDVDISSNIIGDPITNAGFCEHRYNRLIKIGDGKNLEKILKGKLNYYVNSKGDGPQCIKFLHGHFSCLLHNKDDIDEACFNAPEEANAWVRFQTDDEVADAIKAVCDIVCEEHAIYKLMTTSFELPDLHC